MFGHPPTPLADALHPDSKFRPVRIHHFIKLSLTVEHNVQFLLLTVVSWYLPHPEKVIMDKPAQVWCYSKFECSGMHSFVPLHYLKCRCALCVNTLHEFLVVVPLVE